MAMVNVSVTSEIVQPNDLVSGMRNTLQAYTAPSAICITTPAAAMTQRFCVAIDVYPMASALSVPPDPGGRRRRASCRSAAPAVAATPPIVQPGAPGQPSRVIAAAQASDLSQVQYTGADIKFMQGMIGHHAQAVEMVALRAVAHRVRRRSGSWRSGSTSRSRTRCR